MRALIIEDEETLARSIQRRLRSACEVEYATTGRDGMAAFRRGEYDLVFVDLGLPDTDGSEVCARLRFLAPRLPVFAITGLPSGALSVPPPGVRDVIHKSPSFYDDLKAAVDASHSPRAA